MPNKRIILTVTNDLNYDQRMARICNSFSVKGYQVTLVGWKWKNSSPLTPKEYQQKRLYVPTERGKLLYAFYWINLFFYLLFHKADAICAIDLDTIAPVYFASLLKRCKRTYDAHEIFTDLQEVVQKPTEHKIWNWIGQFFIPKFPFGYTIGAAYAQHFKERYGVDYAVVRNATVLAEHPTPPHLGKYILYQGAVNEGRCFEFLIPAMKEVDMPLIICGKGNFYERAIQLVKELNLEDKITFKGYVPPQELPNYTKDAYLGITLFEAVGLSNYLSMANRFFDYMHHCVPQVCMDYPEYKKVNEQLPIAVLVQEPPNAQKIASVLNQLITDKELHHKLAENCIEARQIYNWQEEEKRLLNVYEQLFGK